MANVEKFKIGSTEYPVADATARKEAEYAASEAEYNRQVADGVYQGRSIIDILGASSFDDCVSKLHAKAAAGDFSGLRVMDYLDVTPTVNTVNYGNRMRCRIGKFDYEYQYGDNATPHNILFIPDSPIDMTGSGYAANTSYILWNTTNTNQGTADEKHPYLASNLHKWEVGDFLSALPASLRNVLKDHRELLEERYSASGSLDDSTGWSWASMGKVFSLSETEVYGQVVWGTKGYSVGCSEQLPIFRQLAGKGMRYARCDWWLRSPGSGSSSGVCDDYYGGAACGDATNTWVRPRPCFLVG